MKKILTLTVILFASVVATSAQTDTSLYKRLGGQEGIMAIIDEAIANMASDRRINMKLARADIRVLKNNMDSVVCNKAGGNCQLPTISKKIKLTESEWKAGIEDVTKALNKFGVGPREKSELLELIDILKKDYFEEQ